MSSPHLPAPRFKLTWRVEGVSVVLHIPPAEVHQHPLTLLSLPCDRETLQKLGERRVQSARAEVKVFEVLVGDRATELVTGGGV